MIAYTKQTQIQQIKNILINYFTYKNIKTNLQVHPYISLYIIDEINLLIKNIKFNKIFNLINILTILIDIIDYIINILIKLQNYDIINGLEYIIFYIQYIIERYYYKYNDFYFIYKCIYSIDYFNLCFKHFINYDYKGTNDINIFSDVMFLSFFTFIFGPIYYSVLKFIIEKNDNLKNLVFYISHITYHL